MNVLIVDSDTDDTLIFCEILSDIYAANCVVEADWGAALTTFRKMETPAFIFIDPYSSPDDGLQCLGELKKIIDPEKTRILIYSDVLSPRKKDEFAALGAKDFVIKTGDIIELKSCLRHAIDDYIP